MTRNDHLGEFENLVLLAILRLRDEAYGVTIRKLIRDETGRSPSLGVVYSALRRLEAKGFVKSRHGEPEPIRGGRAKKYFDIQQRGLQVLRGSLADVLSMAAGLDEVLPQGAGVRRT